MVSQCLRCVPPTARLDGLVQPQQTPRRETATSSEPNGKRHYVVSKIVLASIVLVAVVPPWFWYLVPRAHGAHDAHCGQPSRKPPTEGAEALVIVKL